MSQPTRLDVALVEKGFAKSRTRAKVLIENGCVLVDGKVCKKPAFLLAEGATLLVDDQERFVSRGGYKLLKAIETFSLSIQGLICLDVGASTGGFTDCMLQHGAGRVYAVDVGTNQLVEPLRSNPQVICKEQYNFRYANPQDFEASISFASVDVSFISLACILPALYQVLSPEALAVCLIKPQFEAGREHIGKKGIVKSQKVHVKVLEQMMQTMLSQGFSVLGVTFSPITGSGGNVEYLAYLQKSTNPTCVPVAFAQLVEQAHSLAEVTTV